MRTGCLICCWFATFKYYIYICKVHLTTSMLEVRVGFNLHKNMFIKRVGVLK